MTVVHTSDKITVLKMSMPQKLVVDEHVYLRNSGILPSMKHDKFLTNYVVHFNNKVLPAMKAPTMEVTFFKLKKGKSKRQLNDILTSVATKPEIAGSPYAPLTWGDVEGTGDQIYLLFGWESLEKHKMTVQQPTFSQFITDLIETVDFTFCHVEFQTIYFAMASALYL
ncbi:hypothetical protein JR316_0007257 [Psilocybe cubensis]|uniref:Uncharacterized protein n=2 Tax=Psilocybe cubensis TaxID=181762 RepID=A0A8H7XSY6_PSICU|nr:hypothetical protein JR316_0007257 [Psilocybe cubensis]KAH9480657.1 hypothetical protein JR316_0007257 [Psilocybe cubensis]